MANRVRHRKADTSPTKEVVVNSLTKDATTEACIFDLIDNAIDSARAKVEQGDGKADHVGLPSSYKGVTVGLTVAPNLVTVSDNAGGISQGDLESRVLRFGARSAQSHGIGFYGVGLNRALFKLGKKIRIDTDDGVGHSLLELDVDQYLASSEWTTQFVASGSTGKRGTTISLSDPPGEISQELSDPAWQSLVKEDLGRRYHLFLQKGVQMSFQGAPVEPIFVSIRDISPFPKLQKSFRLDNKVWVHIEAGQHMSHRFAAESKDIHGPNPKELTRDFGWSVFCNDRQILEADRTEKTGWEPTWHGEYNGFVGRVHFVSSSPADLPWNTSKTDIDRNNPHYRRVLEDMKAFAARWRHFTRLAKSAKAQGKTLPLPNAPAPKATPKPEKAPGKKSSTSPSSGHTRTVLDQDVDEAKCHGKLLELVREGKRIDFYENWYTGLALVRILFEISTIHYVKRKQIFQDCRDWCIESEEAASKKPFAASYKRQYMPSLATLLDYLTANWNDVIGPSAAYLQKNLESFKRYKGEMDGAVHHPFHQTDLLRAVEMRDAVHPLLRHFIEP